MVQRRELCEQPKTNRGEWELLLFDSLVIYFDTIGKPIHSRLPIKYQTTTAVTTTYTPVFHFPSLDGGGGLLPNPSIFLLTLFVLVVLLVVVGNCVGSGVPAIRALNTCLYNSAAGQSYRCRIEELSKSIPCVSKKSRHCWLPPYFIRTMWAGSHESILTLRTREIWVPKPLLSCKNKATRNQQIIREWVVCSLGCCDCNTLLVRFLQHTKEHTNNKETTAKF